MAVPQPPEPCRTPISGGRCRSPSACSEFGYCRHRNFEFGVPNPSVALGWKIIAQRRRKEAIQAGLWPYMRDR